MGEDIEKRRTTVSIFGQSYCIKGKEDVSHIIEVASFVDEKMKELRRTNPYLDKTQLAVLTAVNLCDMYLKIKKTLDEEEEKKEKDGEL